MIDYSIIAYIYIDWYEFKLNRKCCFSILLCFTFLPFIFALSGLRNGMASCIEALAVYLFLHKRLGLKIFAILSLIAFTTHYISIVAIPIVIVSRFKPKASIFGLILFSSFFINFISNVFKNSSNEVMRLISSAYISYSSEDQYWGSNYSLVVVLSLIFIVIICYLIGRQYRLESSSEGLSIKSFCIYYSAYIIANIGNYDLVLRPAYIFGALSPCLSSIIIFDHNGKASSKILILLLTTVCLLLTIYFNLRSLLSLSKAYS